MKFLPKLTIVVFAGLMATACATPAQLEAERRQQEYERDYNACVRYGAVPNTPAFTDCMHQQAQHRYGPDNREYTYDPYNPYDPYDPYDRRYYDTAPSAPPPYYPPRGSYR